MTALLLALACSGPLNTRQPPTPEDTDAVDTEVADTDTAEDTGEPGPCGVGMAYIDDGPFCIDRYEAALVDHSPYEIPEGEQTAYSEAGVVPQGYISGTDAAAACANAGKRLCTATEWMRACQGPSGTTWPYGNTYEQGACNDTFDGHPVVNLYGSSTDWSPEQMNDPAINQQADSLDPAGANPDCVSAEGVFDLHGNLHEWIADPDGTFKGGFYADASINGEGCTYQTTAHAFGYRDYSTGFRCCADP